jgi:hypothetical protein
MIMKHAIKCMHCPDGYRHPVGNCVLCGWGPSPTKNGEFRTTPKASEKERVLERLEEEGRRRGIIKNGEFRTTPKTLH